MEEVDPGLDTDLKLNGKPIDPTDEAQITRQLEAWALEAIADDPFGQQALYAVAAGRTPFGRPQTYSDVRAGRRDAGFALTQAVEILINGDNTQDNAGKVQRAYRSLLAKGKNGAVTRADWAAFKNECFAIFKSKVNPSNKPLNQLNRAGTR